MADEPTDWRAWMQTFDRLAPTYDQDTADPWLRYEAAWEFVQRSLTAALGGVAGKVVLDVGCGTGEYLRRLVGLGAVGIGVEPSAGMRREACRKVPEAKIIDGDLATIPLVDGSVDAAIATYVVSHLEPAEQPAALDELLRVTTPSGPVVIVDVPVVAAADLPRARASLAAAGRSSQIEWYERSSGLDLGAWTTGLERTGRRSVVEPLGPLLIGLAGLPR